MRQMSTFGRGKSLRAPVVVRSGLKDGNLVFLLHLSVASKMLLMGAKSQHRPKNLARKLLRIRNALGLSQSEMLRRLGAEDSFSAARISEYETGAREPSFWMLLNYGRVARVHVESLIDDNATLLIDFLVISTSGVPNKS